MNFFALQLLFFAFAYLTFHIFAFAVHLPALPSSAIATHIPAQLYPCESVLRFAAAYQFVAFLCRCGVSHSCSTPWLLIVLPSHALAAPCLSRQCHCKAYRLDSELCRCSTSHVDALPLLHSSMQFLRATSQGSAIAMLLSAIPSCALAKRTRADRYHCTQSRISYVNRPLPELRHWPMPRIAP